MLSLMLEYSIERLGSASIFLFIMAAMFCVYLARRTVRVRIRSDGNELDVELKGYSLKSAEKILSTVSATDLPHYRPLASVADRNRTLESRRSSQ